MRSTPDILNTPIVCQKSDQISVGEILPEHHLRQQPSLLCFLELAGGDQHPKQGAVSAKNAGKEITQRKDHLAEKNIPLSPDKK